MAYNGSVGHTCNSGLRRWPSVAGEKANAINLPEWIIALNGIAIQTFNFENEAMSWATMGSSGDTIAYDSDVAALINGYHSCYTIHPTPNDRHVGCMSILMEDGSVSQYLSLDDSPTGPYFTVPGEYRSCSKDDRNRGYLNPADTTFTLFQEDGTRVLFQIYRPIWKTIVDNYPEHHDSLILLLPLRWADQQGHEFLTVTYRTSIGLSLIHI